MNQTKAHKILSWLLLLFFAVGQIIVYAHQHHLKYNSLTYNTSHNTDKHPVVHEKCNFCDQMHHAPIYMVQPFQFGQVLTLVKNIFYASRHHYKGKSLVHADGLSPPALV